MCSPFGTEGMKGGPKMATAKLTVNGSSWLDFLAVMRKLEPFRTSGNLEGGPDKRYTGMLSGPERKEFDDASKAGELDYVVLSYVTPIAWHNSRTGEWTCPDANYSKTTAKQLSRIRPAVTRLNEEREAA